MDAPSPPTPSQAPSPERPLWRNASFLFFWAGQSVSWLGSGISTAAFPLLALTRSENTADAGVSLALVVLPRVVFGLPAGSIVDRMDRRTVMMVASLAQALAAGGIVALLYANRFELRYLFLFAALQGIAATLFEVANDSALPRLVGPRHLAAAISAMQLSFAVAGVLGPLLGGVLFQLHASLPFVVDGLSFVACALSLLPIRLALQGERSAAPPALLPHLREGLSWVFKHPTLVGMLALFSVVTLYFSAGMLLSVSHSMKLGATSQQIGLLFSMSAVGSIVGAALAARWVPRLRHLRVMLASTWALALLMPFIAFVPNYLYMSVICALTLVAQAFFFVALFSLRAQLVPDERLGRVISLFEVLGSLMQPAGFVLCGLFYDRVGVLPTTLVFSVLVLGVTVAFELRLMGRSAEWLARGATKEGVH